MEWEFDNIDFDNVIEEQEEENEDEKEVEIDVNNIENITC